MCPYFTISFVTVCMFFRNLSADVTRFLPTALRVKRDEKPMKTHRIPSGTFFPLFLSFIKRLRFYQALSTVGYDSKPVHIADIRGEIALTRQQAQAPSRQGVTKDDAYQQFMREMEGLL